MAGLLARLEEQGLGPPLVQLASDRISHSDQLELLRIGGTYRVAEMERGQVVEEYCLTGSAGEALDVFASQLARRSVFLASFSDEASADCLRAALEHQGIRAWPNHVLTLRDIAPLYRLFVPALDWQQARAYFEAWQAGEQAA